MAMSNIDITITSGDNYIMFEGKKIPLTDEQVQMLKDTEKSKEVKKSQFERVGYNEKYYTIGNIGNVYYATDITSSKDNKRFDTANYCTDKKLMEQRALHETLNRLLWRFSMENGEGERLGDEDHAHWYIEYSHVARRYYINWAGNMHNIGAIYFPAKELAQRAIDEIIKPFMKEHPDFVW